MGFQGLLDLLVPCKTETTVEYQAAKFQAVAGCTVKLFSEQVQMSSALHVVRLDVQCAYTQSKAASAILAYGACREISLARQAKANR